MTMCYNNKTQLNFTTNEELIYLIHSGFNEIINANYFRSN
jgi:hypothetical protein